MRRGRAGLVAAATVAVTIATCVAVAAPGAEAAPGRAGPGGGAGSGGGTSWQVVTLLTGDRVRVATEPGGQQYAQVQPGPGRDRVVFFRRSHGAELSVIPSDAAPLLAAGRVDPALFDVTALVRDGYADPARADLPLVVGYQPGKRAGSPRGASVVRSLPALNATAVSEPKAAAGAFWRDVTGGQGVAHVWLDAKVHALLDHSVPQISAPVAWQRGLTGKGVTVGVLDTGIDATHPDLSDAVAVARDFTGSANGTRDLVGHGTHVASIITGSGAASGGRYVGVAPDARLAVGKVLDDTGNGTFSQVIAGMEWAAGLHLPVVNMSLGVDLPSDGTDPVSATVDALTARTGTLFVIAAGNAGADESVGIPAVAASALTVGAVDGADVLAPFSSRGPRRGDAGVKPDITAPGVGIVAARAAGTEDGEPVGDSYVRLDGTSMATPHVTGAAAILAQQHPDWAPERLKAALMNTADPSPDSTVYEQGAGRVDVGRVTAGQVWASPASLAVDLPAGQRTAVTRTVTVRNDGAAATRLHLDLPGAPFTLSAGDLTIPAGGSAQVTVTVDPAKTAEGRTSGRLTATADGRPVLSVPVGVVAEPALHTVRVTGIDRNGHTGPASVEILPWADLVNLATGEFAPVFLSGNGIAARVPAGRYDLTAYVDTAGPDGQVTSSTLVTIPTLTVAGDLSLTADARRAKPITVTLDSRTAARSGVDFAGAAQTIAGQFVASAIGSADAAVGLYATPTPEVRSRPYAFYYKSVRAEPLGAAAPRAYDLDLVTRGRIPARLDLRVHDRDLARLDARYHADGSPLAGVQSIIPVLPGETFPLGGGSYEVRLPGARTELFSASPGLRWGRWIDVGTSADQVDLTEVATGLPALRPGERARYDWNSAAFGAVAAPGPRIKCDPDAVLMAAYAFTSPAALQEFAATTSHLDVLRNGAVVGSVDDNVGCFPSPPGPSSYAMHLTAERQLPWTALGSRVDVTWTSAYTPDTTKPLDGPPMINLRVGGDFDARNRAAADRPLRLAITGRLDILNTPAPARTPIRLTSVEVSTDDGRTWHAVPVTADGADRWTAVVPPLRSGRYASLRLRAADGSGDAVDQTVIRAYGLR
jgi:subtilisin family serine protease